MADRQPQAGLLRMLAEQRQAVGGGGAKTGPAADGIHPGQRRQVVEGAAQQARQHRPLDLGIEAVELPRGAEQDLPGRPRLGVEGHRGAVVGVGTGGVTQLDQLVVDTAGVAVGDEQVALLRADRQLRTELAGVDATCQHHELGLQPLAAGQAHAVAVDFADLRVAQLDASAALGEQPACGVRRIDDAVAADLQRPGQIPAQHWLGPVQGLGVEHLAGNALGAEDLALVFGCLQLLAVGRQPQGAAVAVSAVGVELRRPLAPQLDGVAAEGQFRRAVVHRHQVAHAHPGGAAALAVKHQHIQATAGEFMGAGAADDAGADDDDLGIHPRMPQAKGSSSSSSRVASALMWARPRMVGTMRRASCHW